MYTLWVSKRVGGGWVGGSILRGEIFFPWPVCLHMHMVPSARAYVAGAFVSAITLIDSEKARTHAIVIIGCQLILSQ